MNNRFKKCFNILILLFLFNEISLPGDVFTYLGTTDTVKEKITITIEKDHQNYHISHSRAQAIQNTRCDMARNTREWSFQNAVEKTHLNVIRKNNMLEISGTLHGNSIQKTEKIDNNPWFQAMAFSLISFVNSEQTSTEFWSLRPTDFKPFKMKAKKETRETLTFNQTTVETQKVKVSLTGFLSVFWSSYYWFSINDGTWMRYEGVNGPPGTPKTIIERIQ
ncbi:hypothetical protein JW964_02635 [candidate division KSB1 bacterium]|nr:hypothetical protein [candidate division KSB1 bacterium]